MGCGTSKVERPAADAEAAPKAAAPASKTLVLLVRSARNLRSGSDVLGKADPYALVRVGPKQPENLGGVSFGALDVATERCSRTVFGTCDPVWNMALQYESPGDDGVVHIVLLDRDVFSPDDIIGQARVPISALSMAGGEFQLVSPHNTTGAEEYGFVTLAGGIVESTDAASTTGWLSELLGPGEEQDDSLLASLGQYYSRRLEDARYYSNMLKLLMAGKKSRDGSRFEWWTALSAAHGEKGVLLNDWPREHATMYLTHAEVQRRMAALPEGLGTDNANGTITRRNFLGVQELNGAMWPELGENGCIGLAQTVENHAFVRPLLDRMVGPERGRWSRAQVRASAEAFWQGRTACVVQQDIKVWVCLLLHQIHLDMALSLDEATAFMAMQGKCLMRIGVPPSAMQSRGVHALLGLDALLAERAGWLARYKEALAHVFPEEAAKASRGYMGDERLNLLASNTMDSLMFAGGQSVQTVLGQCMAVLFSERGQSETLPEGWALRPSTALPFVLEVVRRWPPVSVLAYVERAAPPRPVFLSVQMAHRDEKAWGPDVHGFNPARPAADHARLSLAWAEPALAPSGDNGDARSRVCVGRLLSQVLCEEFLRAMLGEATGPEGVAADAPLNTAEWAARLPPTAAKGAKIDWSAYGLDSSFTIERVSA